MRIQRLGVSPTGILGGAPGGLLSRRFAERERGGVSERLLRLPPVAGRDDLLGRKSDGLPVHSLLPLAVLPLVAG